MNIGPTELLILLGILLLLFGATRLPTLARSIGQASPELKEGMKEGVRADADIAGPCPFCGTHVLEKAKFCPGCSKEAAEIVAARSKRLQHSL